MLIVPTCKKFSQYCPKMQKPPPENWDWHVKVILILISQNLRSTYYFPGTMPGTGVFKVEQILSPCFGGYRTVS